MRDRYSLRARTAAALTALGVALAGAVVLTAAPAQARLTATDFGFQTTAYGTRVTAEQVQLRSARTAFSYISCTRLTGIKRALDQDDLAKVNGNEMIEVAGVESTNTTYRRPRKGVVGVQGLNTIASVDLGPEAGPRLSFTGLRTRARAWHGKNGFATSTHIGWSDVALRLTEAPETGTPLDDLLDAINDGRDQLVLQVIENAGEIEIPGLGTLHVGYERNTVRRGWAAASAYVLRIDLENGSRVALGRAWAKITRNLPAGVFRGVGYGAQVDTLDGVAKVGRLATRALPCEGTRGKVRESSLAGLDLGAAGALRLGATNAYSYGIQRRDGSAVGWTKGTVTRVALGAGDQRLVIDGIVGKATVRQTRAGKVLKSAKGTTIGSMTVGGEVRALPDPGEAVKIPRLAIVETRVVDRTRRGITVTAVKITLLTDTPGLSVIKLGNAHAMIKRN